MLTVITNPSDHNFSKSPVMCEIETDNAHTSGDFGDKAKFVFYIPPNPTLHSYFKIESGAISSWFYFTDGTPSSPYVQIALRAVGLTDTQYYNNVLTAILAVTTLINNYNVTYVGGGGFVFEALLPGNTYSNTTSNVGGVDLSFTNLVNGTTLMLTNVPRPNYKIGIDVLVETTIFPYSYLAQVYSAEKEPFANKVKFDISKILDTQLEYYFPTPNQNTSNICVQTSKQFWVQFRELYGSPITAAVTTVTPNSALNAPGATISFRAYILKAGLAPRWNKLQPINQLSAYVWGYPLNLTVRVPSIKIKSFQPEYIFFCFPDNCAQPVVKLTTYLSNGTTSITYQCLYIGTMYKGSVGCFPVNYQSSTIFTQMATGNAIKFTAQIVADANRATGISPLVTYYPDYTPQGDNKVFLYTNSMGGIDTFRSEGNFEQEVEFDKEVSSRLYYTTDAAHLGDAVESQNTKVDVYKVFSGWLTEEKLHELEELFLAKYKVEVIDFTTYAPIIITSKKYRKHETNVFLKGIEIEYYYQLKSPVTDRLAAGL